MENQNKISYEMLCVNPKTYAEEVIAEEGIATLSKALELEGFYHYYVRWRNKDTLYSLRYKSKELAEQTFSNLVEVGME